MLSNQPAIDPDGGAMVDRLEAQRVRPRLRDRQRRPVPTDRAVEITPPRGPRHRPCVGHVRDRDQLAGEALMPPTAREPEVAGVALRVAGVAAAIVAGGGGDDAGKTGIGTRTDARNPPETTTAGAPQSRRKHRQKLRQGHGTIPDRPAPGTGALLAIADQKPE